MPERDARSDARRPGEHAAAGAAPLLQDASRSSRPRAAASRCRLDGRGARTPGKRPLVAPTPRRRRADRRRMGGAGRDDRADVDAGDPARQFGDRRRRRRACRDARRDRRLRRGRSRLLSRRRRRRRSSRCRPRPTIPCSPGRAIRSARVSSRPSASPMSRSRRRRWPRRARRSRLTPTRSPSPRCM